MMFSFAKLTALALLGLSFVAANPVPEAEAEAAAAPGLDLDLGDYINGYGDDYYKKGATKTVTKTVIVKHPVTVFKDPVTVTVFKDRTVTVTETKTKTKTVTVTIKDKKYYY